MAQLISEELNSAICEQIGAEKQNANIYLFIAGFLKNKGFNHLGEFFEKQHEEETEHSLMFFKLLTDMNSPIYIPEIPEVNLKFNSIVDIGNLFLEREIGTTNSLDEIKKLAMEEDCPVVEEHLRGMITLQQNEYAESTDFKDHCDIIGDDWKYVMLWDLSL